MAAAPDAAWALLMDVPRVIPCMPGAQLTETVDEDHWKARLAVKLGPIALTFETDVAREATDAGARQAVLAARAREVKGRGSAQATITSTLAPQDGGTRVDIVTDLALSGAVAQYGRGIVQSVAGQLTASFASCLQAQLAPAASNGGPVVPPAAAARPVAGLRLGLRALLDLIARSFRRRPSG